MSRDRWYILAICLLTAVLLVFIFFPNVLDDGPELPKRKYNADSIANAHNEERKRVLKAKDSLDVKKKRLSLELDSVINVATKRDSLSNEEVLKWVDEYNQSLSH